MSGYAYKEWKGSFYPADLPQDGMLGYYAGRFRAVEINNTFYRMPSEKAVLAWSTQVPEGFTFVLKASQKITHFKRLKDAGGELDYFLKNATALGEKRGPTLFQLPPNMKKDLAVLTDFLALLPHRWRAAFEFRHPTWFDDAVYEALRARQVALCTAEDDDDATPPPVVSTADYGYFRLRRTAYDAAALGRWAEAIRGQPWQDAYVFFKHEEGQPTGPATAQEFAKLVG